MGNCLPFNKLNNASFDNTPTYTLKGIRKECKVLKVYDGDTLWLAISIHKSIYKYRVRMYGYDSPEMKPSLSDINRDLEIEAANEAKNYLEKLVMGQKLQAEFFDYDKYGRPLVKLYINNSSCCFTSRVIDVNEEMVLKGYGKPYFGGKKEKFDH